MVLLVLASVAAYFVVSSGDKNEENNTESSQEKTEQTNAFSPAPTEGQALTATITTTVDGEVNEATIAFDGQGTSEYTAVVNGISQRVIYTPEAYYTCTDAQGCFKFDLSQSTGTNVNPEDYQFNSDKSDEFNTTATYEGQMSCESGTCNVWTSSSFKNQGKTTVYVDSKTKNIIKVESTVDGTKSTITYDYSDVTIEIPTDVEELPAGI